MNECEKRGLSIVEDSHLNQEAVVEHLWKKVQKAEYVFRAAESSIQTKRIVPAVIDEEDVDNLESVDFPGAFSCPATQDKRKYRHIVGLVAKRFDDSRKKWRVNKVIMGCEGLLTS